MINTLFFYYIENNSLQRYIILSDNSKDALLEAKEHCREHMKGDWKTLKIKARECITSKTHKVFARDGQRRLHWYFTTGIR